MPGQRGAAAVRLTLHAVSFVLRALELATRAAHANRYRFLVFNCSVVYWRIARSLLRRGRRTLALPSLRRVVDAVLGAEEPNAAWRIQLLCELAAACDEAGALPEAVERASRALQLCDEGKGPSEGDPGFVAAAQRLTVLRHLAHLGRHAGEGAKALAAAKASAADEPAVAALVQIQAVRSGDSSGTEAESALRAVLEPAYPGILADADSRAADGARVLPEAGPAEGAEEGRRAPPIPTVAPADVEWVAQCARLALTRGYLRLAFAARDAAAASSRRAPPTGRAQAEILEAEVLARGVSAREGRRLPARQVQALALSRRADSLKQLERTLIASRRVGDMETVQEVCALLWTISLPLLTNDLRRHAHRALQAASAALAEGDSPLLQLRAQIHMELARCELGADFLAKAQAETRAALRLDYGDVEDEEAPRLPGEAAADVEASTTPGTVAQGGDEAAAAEDAAPPRTQDELRPLDRYLAPLEAKLDLKASLYDEPERSEERALLLLEQAKEAGSVQLRRALLKRALTTMEEDQALDSAPAEGEGKEEEGEGKEEEEGQVASPREKSRLLVYAELARLAWSLREATTAGAAAAAAVQRSWCPRRCRDLVVEQAGCFFVLAECRVHELGQSRAQQSQQARQPRGGGLDPRALGVRSGDDALDAAKEKVVDALARGMALGEATALPQLVENAAVYAWNLHMHLLTTAADAERLPCVDDFFREASSALERVGSSDGDVRGCVLRGVASFAERGGDSAAAIEACDKSIALRPVPFVVDSIRRKVRLLLASGKGAKDAVEAVAATPRYEGADAGMQARAQGAFARVLAVAAALDAEGAVQGEERVTWVTDEVQHLRQELEEAEVEAQAAEAAARGETPAAAADGGAAAAQGGKKGGGGGRGDGGGGAAEGGIPAPDPSPLENREAAAALQVGVYARLARHALGAGALVATQQCGKLGVAVIPEDEKARAAMPAGVWQWAAVLESLWGQAVAGKVDPSTQEATVQDELRCAALAHFALSAQWASRVGRASLVLDAARRIWNASMPMADAATTRSLLKPALRSALRALADVGDASDGQLCLDLYKLLLQCLADERDWQRGLEVVEEAFSHVPQSLQRPLWQTRVLFTSNLGKDAAAGLVKMKSGSVEAQARAWLALARNAAVPADQLRAYQGALTAVGDSFYRADVLVALAEWMHASHCPAQDVQEALFAAVDVILAVDDGAEEAGKTLEEAEEAEEAGAGPSGGGGASVARSARSGRTARSARSGRTGRTGGSRGGGATSVRSGRGAGTVATSAGGGGGTEDGDGAPPSRLGCGHLLQLAYVHILLASSAVSFVQRREQLLLAHLAVVRCVSRSLLSAAQLVALREYAAMEEAPRQEQTPGEYLATRLPQLLREDRRLRVPDTARDWLHWFPGSTAGGEEPAAEDETGQILHDPAAAAASAIAAIAESGGAAAVQPLLPRADEHLTRDAVPSTRAPILLRGLIRLCRCLREEGMAGHAAPVAACLRVVAARCVEPWLPPLDGLAHLQLAQVADDLALASVARFHRAAAEPVRGLSEAGARALSTHVETWIQQLALLERQQGGGGDAEAQGSAVAARSGPPPGLPHPPLQRPVVEAVEVHEVWRACAEAWIAVGDVQAATPLLLESQRHASVLGDGPEEAACMLLRAECALMEGRLDAAAGLVAACRAGPAGSVASLHARAVLALRRGLMDAGHPAAALALLSRVAPAFQAALERVRGGRSLSAPLEAEEARQAGKQPQAGHGETKAVETKAKGGEKAAEGNEGAEQAMDQPLEDDRAGHLLRRASLELEESCVRVLCAKAEQEAADALQLRAEGALWEADWAKAETLLRQLVAWLRELGPSPLLCDVLKAYARLILEHGGVPTPSIMRRPGAVAAAALLGAPDSLEAQRAALCRAREAVDEAQRAALDIHVDAQTESTVVDTPEAAAAAAEGAEEGDGATTHAGSACGPTARRVAELKLAVGDLDLALGHMDREEEEAQRARELAGARDEVSRWLYKTRRLPRPEPEQNPLRATRRALTHFTAALTLCDAVPVLRARCLCRLGESLLELAASDGAADTVWWRTQSPAEEEEAVQAGAEGEEEGGQSAADGEQEPQAPAPAAEEGAGPEEAASQASRGQGGSAHEVPSPDLPAPVRGLVQEALEALGEAVALARGEQDWETWGRAARALAGAYGSRQPARSMELLSLSQAAAARETLLACVTRAAAPSSRLRVLLRSHADREAAAPWPRHDPSLQRLELSLQACGPVWQRAWPARGVTMADRILPTGTHVLLLHLSSGLDELYVGHRVVGAAEAASAAGGESGEGGDGGGEHAEAKGAEGGEDEDARMGAAAGNHVWRVQLTQHQRRELAALVVEAGRMRRPTSAFLKLYGDLHGTAGDREPTHSRAPFAAGGASVASGRSSATKRKSRAPDEANAKVEALVARTMALLQEPLASCIPGRSIAAAASAERERARARAREGEGEGEEDAAAGEGEEERESLPSCVVLADAWLAALPLEALPALRGAACARDLSAALLCARALDVARGAGGRVAVQPTAGAFVVDPYAEHAPTEKAARDGVQGGDGPVGELHDASPAGQVLAALREANVAGAASWEGVVGTERIPSEGDWQRLLRGGASAAEREEQAGTGPGVFLYLGPGRLLAQVPCRAVAGLDLRARALLVDAGCTETDASSRRQGKADNGKTAVQQSAEGAVETAAVLAAAGCASYVANQWGSTWQANRRLACGVLQRWGEHGGVARAVHEVWHGPGEGAQWKQRVMYNTVAWGLPTLPSLGT